jgi:hypothetical protein
MRVLRIASLVLCLGCPSMAFAQDANPDSNRGVQIPDSERLRVNVRFMASYGNDESHYGIGNESQGRVGYAIVDLFGKITGRFSYRFEINPVHETQPLPACGEDLYFYPNVPQAFGPAVVCDSDGRMRVDDYKFTALDVLNQQGPIRQAYLDYRTESGFIRGRFGRFILPIGFYWEDAGSFTSKDATHIQRINAEANFGFMLTFSKPLVTFNAAAFIGEGNRFHDYDYFYSLDWSFDNNSAISGLLGADFHLAPALDLRFVQKAGTSGSKVEKYPNFYASKRNDQATVVSARYRPVSHVAVFGEFASYLWGPPRTSAELIGWSDTRSIRKNGYYVGADVSVPVTANARVGGVFTYETLDRDDALIKHLTLANELNVRMGEEERARVLRFYTDLGRHVRAGVYVTLLDNPFPWVSGIWPIAGQDAFVGLRGNNKWGVVGRFSLD